MSAESESYWLEWWHCAGLSIRKEWLMIDVLLMWGQNQGEDNMSSSWTSWGWVMTGAGGKYERVNIGSHPAGASLKKRSSVSGSCCRRLQYLLTYHLRPPWLRQFQHGYQKSGTGFLPLLGLLPKRIKTLSRTSTRASSIWNRVRVKGRQLWGEGREKTTEWSVHQHGVLLKCSIPHLPHIPCANTCGVIIVPNMPNFTPYS